MKSLEFVKLKSLHALCKYYSGGLTVYYRLIGSHGSSVWLKLNPKTVGFVDFSKYDYAVSNDELVKFIYVPDKTYDIEIGEIEV